MKDTDFQKLVESIKEAGQVKRGQRKPARLFDITPPQIRRVRQKLKVSQAEFALMIGVSLRTLQNWEQGRRRPEGPASALLRVASRNPEAILEALHA